jgi:hypothetical protein
MSWRATFIRDGVPWSVNAVDIDSLAAAGTVYGLQMVVSADGEEAILASTGTSPVVQAISTTTGATLWQHDAYPVDGENRNGELIGSPRAGRYLWRNRLAAVDPVTVAGSQWMQGIPEYRYQPFPFDPRQYEAASVNVTVYADWYADAVGVDPDTGNNLYDDPFKEARNGILGHFNWADLTVETAVSGIYEVYGNLAMNIDSVEEHELDAHPYAIYHCHCDFTGCSPPLTTMPMMTGNAADLTVTANPGYDWTISGWTVMGTDLTVTFTGSADTSIIELRDQNGNILDTASDPNFSDNQRWLALQPNMNAYVRYAAGQGPG